MRFFSACLLLIIVSGCSDTAPNKRISESFDFQGHRGARALFPENTVLAALKAIEFGATTIELDLVISNDKQVVLSHDHYFNHEFTTAPDGNPIDAESQENYLLYTMSYDSIRKYDVGRKTNPKFPKQVAFPATKPLFSDLINAIEAFPANPNRLIRYNVEIKSNPEYDGIRHPAPEEFSELVVEVIKSKGVENKTTIQSFDARPLQYIHRQYPDIELSYLIEKPGKSVSGIIEELGFTPDIISPHYLLVTKKLIADCHANNIKVLPWTVNDLNKIKELMNAGVDGIITDQADYFLILNK